MNNLEYSVVVPVFNSEQTLEELFLRIKTVFQDLKKTFQVIFVEDGGTDNSWNVLVHLKEKYPDIITAIKLTKNFGQHNATFCGLKYSKGKFIITIDDDLQIPPEEIKKLITAYQKNEQDVIYGFYTSKRHSLLRNLGSKIIKKSSKYFFKHPGEGSSFRLFIQELAQKMLSHHQNFVFIDELLLWYTGNIAFIEVEHQKRKVKKSGYTTMKLIKLTTNIIIYSSAIPLIIMVYGGLFASLISFLAGGYYIFRKIFFNVPLGYTSIIVTIFFSTSILLLSLGIIGEYLRRVYMTQNKKPPYLINKILK